MNYYKPTSFFQKAAKVLQLFFLQARISRKPVRSLKASGLSVLMVVPSFDRTGGYEKQAEYLSTSVAALGNFITLLTDGRNGRPREFRNGFLIHRLSQKTLGLFLFFLFKKRRFHTLHVHGVCGFSLFAIRIAKTLGLPSVLKIPTRGDIEDLFLKNGLKRRLYRKWLSKTDVFIAVSREIRNELADNGFGQSRIESIPNSVDILRFHPAHAGSRYRLRQRAGIRDEQVVFLYLGRLEKRKGINFLLHAWDDSGVLWIVGSGPEEAELMQIVAERNLQKVVFFGETSSPLQFYQAADVFVFPSLKEGAPNAILEAMSCGLAIIATRIGGIVEQVEHEQEGLLVSPGSSEELLKAFQHAASHPEDLKRWGANAVSKVRNQFDMKQISPRYIELYSRLSRKTL